MQATISMTNSNGKPIDCAAALNRMGGDEQLLRDLGGFYLEDVPPLFDALKGGLARQDAESVSRAAHSLKSLSANFDAHQACHLAEVVERAARAGDLATAARMVDDVESAVAEVSAAIRTEVLETH